MLSLCMFLSPPNCSRCSRTAIHNSPNHTQQQNGKSPLLIHEMLQSTQSSLHGSRTANHQPPRDAPIIHHTWSHHPPHDHPLVSKEEKVCQCSRIYTSSCDKYVIVTLVVVMHRIWQKISLLLPMCICLCKPWNEARSKTQKTNAATVRPNTETVPLHDQISSLRGPCSF